MPSPVILPVASATMRDGLCGIFSRWLWRRRTARKNAETNTTEILLRLSLDFLFMVSCTRNMVPLFVCRANLSRECLGKLQELTIRSREPRSPGTVKSMVQSSNRPQELRWGIWGLIYENKASPFLCFMQFQDVSICSRYNYLERYFSWNDFVGKGGLALCRHKMGQWSMCLAS